VITIPQLTTGRFCCFGLRTRVSNDVTLGIHLGPGVYITTNPPFYIDSWWEEQLGKIEIRLITGCGLFLLAIADDAAIEHRDLERILQSHYLSLLFQGVGYSRVGNSPEHGIILGGENSNQGMRVSSVGRLLDYQEPAKVISAEVSQKHFEVAAHLARGIETIFSTTWKKEYLRLRKGFNVFLNGAKQNELHNRLHQFVRAIEAVIKPKQGDGTRNFRYRCQFFAGRKAEDAKLLEELYELRSAAEHLNALDGKLSDYRSHELDNIKAQRTFQCELLAAFIYRKILSTPTLLQHFISDETIDNLWTTNDARKLIDIWGDTLDLHQAPQGLFFDYLGF
jgi:hypothetical protein